MDQFKSKGRAMRRQAECFAGHGGRWSTTFIRRSGGGEGGVGKPSRILTPESHIRLGKRSEKRWASQGPGPLARLDEMVCGGWTTIPADAYTAAAKARCSSRAPVSAQAALSQISRGRGATGNVVSVSEGANVKKAPSARLAGTSCYRTSAASGQEHVLARLDGLVSVHRGVPGAGLRAQSIAAFEKAWDADHPNIYPVKLYAYAAIMSWVPYMNGAPTCLRLSRPWGILAEKRGGPSVARIKTGRR